MHYINKAIQPSKHVEGGKRKKGETNKLNQQTEHPLPLLKTKTKQNNEIKQTNKTTPPSPI